MFFVCVCVCVCVTLFHHLRFWTIFLIVINIDENIMLLKVTPLLYRLISYNQ